MHTAMQSQKKVKAKNGRSTLGLRLLLLLIAAALHGFCLRHGPVCVLGVSILAFLLPRVLLWSATGPMAQQMQYRLEAASCKRTAM